MGTSKSKDSSKKSTDTDKSDATKIKLACYRNFKKCGWRIKN